MLKFDNNGPFKLKDIVYEIMNRYRYIKVRILHQTTEVNYDNIPDYFDYYITDICMGYDNGILCIDIKIDDHIRIDHTPDNTTHGDIPIRLGDK